MFTFTIMFVWEWNSIAGMSEVVSQSNQNSVQAGAPFTNMVSL